MIDSWPGYCKEEAALLLAAIQAAKDQFGPPPAKPGPVRGCRATGRAWCGGVQQC